MIHKSGARPFTTGRFKTRLELIDKACCLYKTNLKITKIGHNCGISQTTASKIIDTHYNDWLKAWENDRTYTL